MDFRETRNRIMMDMRNHIINKTLMEKRRRFIGDDKQLKADVDSTEIKLKDICLVFMRDFHSTHERDKRIAALELLNLKIAEEFIRAPFIAKVVMSTGLFDTILDSLGGIVGNDIFFAKEATTLLINTTAVEDKDSIKAITNETKFIEILMRLIETSSNQTVQSNALQALGNLVVGSVDARDALSQERFLETIEEILDRNTQFISDELPENILYSLSNFLEVAPPLLFRTVSSIGLRCYKLFKCMVQGDVGSFDAYQKEMLRYCLLILNSVTSTLECEQLPEFLWMFTEIVQIFSQLLREKDLQTNHIVLLIGILDNLLIAASTTTSFDMELIDLKVIERLLELLSNEQSTVVISSLNLLSNFCITKNDEVADLMATTKIINEFIRVCYVNSNSRIKSSGLMCITNLARSLPAEKAYTVFFRELQIYKFVAGLCSSSSSQDLAHTCIRFFDTLINIATEVDSDIGIFNDFNVIEEIVKEDEVWRSIQSMQNHFDNSIADSSYKLVCSIYKLSGQDNY